MSLVFPVVNPESPKIVAEGAESNAYANESVHSCVLQRNQNREHLINFELLRWVMDIWLADQAVSSPAKLH